MYKSHKLLIPSFNKETMLNMKSMFAAKRNPRVSKIFITFPQHAMYILQILSLINV